MAVLPSAGPRTVIIRAPGSHNPIPNEWNKDMEEYHRLALDRLRERFREDPRYPALIVGGSIVKGLARPDSDIDAMFVATDEEFERCRRARQHLFMSGDFTDYEGGYVDGKIINLQFLRDVADHGSEPARSAFLSAILLYSRVPEVEQLMAQIPVYPTKQKEEKIRSFFCQVKLLRWFVEEAEKRDQRYLLLRSAAELALYAGRIVLADNEVLYPHHKWFMLEVRRAKRKPAEICDLLDELLRNPCIETATRLEQCVVEHYDPGLEYLQIGTRYIRDREWNWMEGSPPLEDS
jgi:predicted nucleotidyltransferase